MDYKDTLNLPRSLFPMKARLGQSEPLRVKKWREDKLYSRIMNTKSANPSFVLHDGPPYANGNIHIGHALNKILKDIILKYKLLDGYFTPYIPGWDCHGLPIEHKVASRLGSEKIASMSKIQIRRKCRDYALKYLRLQKEEFQRLGCLGDWDNPYLTLDPQYETGILEVLQKLVEKGAVYKSLKPVSWCADCRTALAEAEVEYHDHASPSVFVSFPVKQGNASFNSTGNLCFVIWTTTPWTLPANVGVCLHPAHSYVIAQDTEGNKYILAEDLMKLFAEKTDKELSILEKCTGKHFEGFICQHPFIEDRESKIVLDQYVTLEQGTGCVHIAPGHGQEDYLIGLQYNLPVLAPVDDNGRFTEDFKPCEGMRVFEANTQITTLLNENNALLLEEKVDHSYPHCWRCKQPVIMRATEQWFIDIDHNELRKRALREADDVAWIPDWGKERIKNMISSRSDWCISRQRSWGVPIPAFQCTSCRSALLETGLISHFRDIVKQEGTDAWFTRDVKDLLPEGYQCPHCNNDTFEKEHNIIDVWFESGVSHHSVLEKREDLKVPSDLYLEGSDQHRGWFQSSLLTSVAFRNKAPFKIVLTHGFLLDGKGKAMHKSAGNAISPIDTCNKMGADILRLWVSSENYREDVRLSDEILQRMSDAYRKIRNSIRFMINNLYDFEPEKDAVPFEEFTELEKYQYSRLQAFSQSVRQAYEQYTFYKVFHLTYNFVVRDLSSFYLDIVKDRLYTFPQNSKERRACQTVLNQTVRTLTLLVAPILSFTADEIWEYLPGDKQESVFLEQFPPVQEKYRDLSLESDFSFLWQLKDLVNKEMENQRNRKKIGHSLDTTVTLYFEDPEVEAVIRRYSSWLETILIASEVKITSQCPQGAFEDAQILKGVRVYIEKKDGEKCPRCWKTFHEKHMDSTRGICDNCKHSLGNI